MRFGKIAVGVTSFQDTDIMGKSHENIVAVSVPVHSIKIPPAFIGQAVNSAIFWLLSDHSKMHTDASGPRYTLDPEFI